MSSTHATIFAQGGLTQALGVFRVLPADAPHAVKGKRLMQLLLPVVLLGLVAGLTALARGHHVMGTTSEIPWGVLISTYVFFAVSSTGLCLVGSLGHIFGFELFVPIGKKAVFLAFVMLLVGFAVIGSELENPLALLKYVMLSPILRSPIWWMGTLYGLYLVLMTVELWFLLTENHVRSRQFGIAKLVAAVAASSNLGSVFGMAHARPYWYGPFLPLYMIVTALVMGAALLTVVVYFEDWFRHGQLQEAHRPLLVALGKLLTLFLGLMLFFTVWRVLSGLAGDHQHLSAVTWAMLTGPLFVSFWAIEVFMGLGFPLAILLGTRRHEPVFLASAAGSVVLAMLVVRSNFVYAGQMFSLKPVVGHLGELVHYGPPFKGSPAGFLAYTPSIVEVGIVAGALAAAAVLFVLGVRALGLAHKEG
jgi:Ni/Fe-hydrogenase subunit HybB-like protein